MLKYKKIISIPFGLFGIILLSMYQFLFDSRTYYVLESTKYIYYLSIIGLLLGIASIITWKKITGTYFTPYILFYLFFYIFNYGQCLMWSVGIHSPSEISTGFIYTKYISFYDILASQVIILAYLSIFHFGALFGSYEKKEKYNQEILKKSMLLVGLITAALSFPITLYRNYTFFKVAITYGYNALYYGNYVSQGGYSMIVEMLFFPSIICIIIGSGPKSKYSKIAIATFTLYTILNVLAGDRGSFMYKIIALIWMYYFLYYELRFDKMIKWLIPSIPFLYVLDKITSSRDMTVKFDNAVNGLHSFFLIKPFFEMGGTMNIVILVRQMVESNYVFKFGNTYITTIFGAAISQIATKIGLQVVLIDDWFSQGYLNIKSGAGFSMFGEALLNGGVYFGAIYIFFIGLFFGRVLFITNRSYLLKIFIAVTSFSILTGWSRGSSFLFAKSWLYGVGLFMILILLGYKYLLNKVVKSQ